MNGAVTAVWSVQDGVLRSAGAPLGYLRTNASYENFVLTVEQRHLTKGNSGLLVGIKGPDRIWSGLEFQTATGNAGDIWNHNLLKMSGDLMRTERKGRRLVKAGPQSQRPVGAWDLLEVIVDDGVLTYKVNGQIQNTVKDTESLAGKIGLQVEGAQLEFRKVQLTPILSSSRRAEEVLPVEEEFMWVEASGRSEKARALRGLLSDLGGELKQVLEVNANARILVSDAGALIVDEDTGIARGHQKNARWLVAPGGQSQLVVAEINFQYPDVRANLSSVVINLKTENGVQGCHVNFKPDGSSIKVVPGKPCLFFEVVDEEFGRGWKLVVAASTGGAAMTSAELLVIPALGREAVGQLWVVDVVLAFGSPGESNVTDIKSGAAVFNSGCSGCHGFSRTLQYDGPTLRALSSREIASYPGFSYSPALKGRKGHWRADVLLRRTRWKSA